MIGLIIIGIVLVLVLIIWVSVYNSLIKYRNWVDEAWAQIDVQLKRRYDMIPNLVNTVKGYAKHESETLEKVITARNQLVGSGNLSPEDAMTQNDALTSSLKSVFALAESYPDLKANENFLLLQEEIAGTENKISYARQLYNSSVMKYNTKIQSIPNNIVAGIHRFSEKKMLEAAVEERENVVVSF